jgi:hypothetical protein
MKKSEMGGACSTYRRMRGAFRVFVWRPHDKRPLVDNVGEYIEK